MSVKGELHDLVDRLGDDRAVEAVEYLRRLLHNEGASGETALDRLNRRMGPRAVSGHTFFSQQPRDLRALAEQQGVQPINSLDELLGDFWPSNETADEFVATIRRWRREGGCA